MLGIISFRKDPWYIVKTTLFRLPLLVFLLTATLAWKPVSWSQLTLYGLPILLLTLNGAGAILLGLLSGIAICLYDKGFEWASLAYVGIATFLTFPSSALFHGISHMSLRPRSLNRFAAEIIGLWHNVGIEIWSVMHFYHHRHTDVVGLDPHPSLGKGFWGFTKDAGISYYAAFTHHYFVAHPPSIRTKLAYRLASLNFTIRNPLVTLFWFSLLGPTAFVFLYGSNIFLKKIHYAWFNWATHVKKDNEIITINLEEGLYRIINPIAFNLYYHDNHHKHPGLLNPKKLPARNAHAPSKAA